MEFLGNEQHSFYNPENYNKTTIGIGLERTVKLIHNAIHRYKELTITLTQWRDLIQSIHISALEALYSSWLH